MNLIHLKYAVEVEKTGSITQAAENLFMGQPNLSKAIKEFETNMGVMIFKRTPKGVIPTEQGRQILDYAKSILRQIEEMETLYQPDKTDKQVFSISIPRASYAAYAFTNFVNTLDPAREIEIHFKETNSVDAIKQMVEGAYHLGIIRYQMEYEKYFLNLMDSKSIEHKTLWEFEYLALMSKQHPLAQAHPLHYQDLSQYLEIAHGDLSIPSVPLAQAKKMEQLEGFDKHIYVYERGSQFDLLNRIPTTFMWVSPIPQDLLQRNGLIQRKCVMPVRKRKDLLIYPKGYRFSALDQAFVEELRRVLEQMTKIECD